MLPIFWIVTNLITPYAKLFLLGTTFIVTVFVTIGCYCQTVSDHPFADIFAVAKNHPNGSTEFIVMINFNLDITPTDRLY